MRPPRGPAAAPGRPPLAPAVDVSACGGTERGCPHAVIDASAWAGTIREALDGAKLADRLGPLVPPHQVFRVVVAACPNACSRPQIADIGLIGRAVRAVTAGLCVNCRLCQRACADGAVCAAEGGPRFSATCLNCRDCANACPTGAIRIEREEASMTAAGRLGRHPRLAQPIADGLSLSQAVERIVQWAERYAAGRMPAERFAQWFDRTGAAPGGCQPG